MTTKRKIDSSPTSLAPRPLRLRIDTQSEDVRVEVVPLIDVIFCILTFFILAAVGFSRQQAISIDLPKAGTGTPQGREILMVSLNDAGQVFVEQQPVMTKDQFYQRLRDYRQQNPNGLMALYASTNATYNQVVQVLDLLREVGGDRVALATLPGESGTTATPNTTTPLPPAMGVPGVPPAPGTNSFDPYGLQNPATQFNPAQPQVQPNLGQPVPGLGLPPGTNPGNLQPLPGQPGANPGNSALPSPGTTVAPNLNNAAPQQTKPGNPAAPRSGTTTSPENNNSYPDR
ncbi:MAG TPA: biopolymer transporter ExbD [Candidatus Sericytochromatia bacterium]|jgi:biopolymer transport protein ExbD